VQTFGEAAGGQQPPAGAKDTSDLAGGRGDIDDMVEHEEHHHRHCQRCATAAQADTCWSASAAG